MEVHIKAEADQRTSDCFAPIVRITVGQEGEYPADESILYLGLGTATTERQAERNAADHIVRMFERLFRGLF